MSKEIPLTYGAIAIVDDEDYDELSRHKWLLNKDGYAQRTAKKAEKEPRKQRVILMSRFLLGITGNELCDHINGNKLDNRKGNLRIANASQNMVNRLKQRNNTSGYKGVCKTSSCNRWVAQIYCDKQYIYLGRHDSAEEAALAYNLKAKELYGEYARLNDIRAGEQDA